MKAFTSDGLQSYRSLGSNATRFWGAAGFLVRAVRPSRSTRFLPFLSSLTMELLQTTSCSYPRRAASRFNYFLSLSLSSLLSLSVCPCLSLSLSVSVVPCSCLSPASRPWALCAIVAPIERAKQNSAQGLLTAATKATIRVLISVTARSLEAQPAAPHAVPPAAPAGALVAVPAALPVAAALPVVVPPAVVLAVPPAAVLVVVPAALDGACGDRAAPSCPWAARLSAKLCFAK